MFASSSYTALRFYYVIYNVMHSSKIITTNIYLFILLYTYKISDLVLESRTEAIDSFSANSWFYALSAEVRG